MNINLLAPICDSGYGLTGFNLLRALLDRCHDVALFPTFPPEYAPEYDPWIRSAMRRSLNYDIYAPSVLISRLCDMVMFPGKGMKVGLTFFEYETGFHPSEVYYSNNVDLLCVSSGWARDIVVQNKITTLTAVIPLGVDRKIFHEGVQGEPLTVSPDTTIFFHVGKYEQRKGQDHLLAAFNKAFTPADKVLLRMCSMNMFEKQAYNDNWVKQFMSSPLGRAGCIQCVERLATQQQVATFMAAGDCGVFPARAEGWNLDLLEALSLGKPVIATDYSGHTEFLTPDNAMLIAVEAIDSGMWDKSLYNAITIEGRGTWAKLGNDQLEQLIVYLREIHRRKQAGELGLNLNGIETARRLSWSNSASILAERLR